MSGPLDEGGRFDVPDSLEGLPGFADLFLGVAGPRRPEESVPALEPELRDALGRAFGELGVAAAAAAGAVGDALRYMAASLGVDGPDRVLVFEAAILGTYGQVGRVVLADAHRLVELTEDTTPGDLWRTLLTLFDIAGRRLRLFGERDHVYVHDLDLRRSANRTIRPRLDGDGDTVGLQGVWTTVLEPGTYTQPELGPVAVRSGPEFDEVVARLERLLVGYGVRFTLWPDADVPR